MDVSSFESKISKVRSALDKIDATDLSQRCKDAAKITYLYDMLEYQLRSRSTETKRRGSGSGRPALLIAEDDTATVVVQQPLTQKDDASPKIPLNHLQCEFCTIFIRNDKIYKHCIDKHADEFIAKYPKESARSFQNDCPVLRSPNFIACLVCKKGNRKESQRGILPGIWLDNHLHTSKECFNATNWDIYKEYFVLPEDNILTNMP
jgi:hypothetical protein